MLAVQMFIAIYFALDFPRYASPEALQASKLGESDENIAVATGCKKLKSELLQTVEAPSSLDQ